MSAAQRRRGRSDAGSGRSDRPPPRPAGARGTARCARPRVVAIGTSVRTATSMSRRRASRRPGVRWRRRCRPSPSSRRCGSAPGRRGDRCTGTTSVHRSAVRRRARRPRAPPIRSHPTASGADGAPPYSTSIENCSPGLERAPGVTRSLRGPAGRRSGGRRRRAPVSREARSGPMRWSSSSTAATALMTARPSSLLVRTR